MHYRLLATAKNCLGTSIVRHYLRSLIFIIMTHGQLLCLYPQTLGNCPPFGDRARSISLDIMTVLT